MAYEAAQVKVGQFTASADLSGKQYHFVKMSGNNTVTVCAAITDVPIGVLQNTPTSGQADAIAAGSDTTVYVMGIALNAAAAGDVVEAFINTTAGRAA